MQNPKEQEMQPDTSTRDLAEGKPTDDQERSKIDVSPPAGDEAQPGMDTRPPTEGGDNTSGAERMPR